jgi:hypothetical protein
MQYGYKGAMQQKVVTFRLPESEFRLLTRHAAETQRTKTDVLREFIRGLEPIAREAKAKKPKR